MSTEGAVTQSASDHCIAVGVGPIELPEYLDRPEIVTRASPNALYLAQFDQWAEPLETNFTRVLAENLYSLLCADPIAVFPWGGSARIDYQVVVDVVQFDGEVGGDASLSARWSIFGMNGDEALATGKSSFTEPAGAQDYEALVAAKSRAIGDLSRQIARALKNVMRREPSE
jgi:uncharacterized lipoprotein YmbA